MSTLTFHPISQTVRCLIRFTQAGKQMENSLYYTFTGSSPTAAELTALAVEITTTIGRKLQAALHTSVRMTEVICTNIDNAFGNEGQNPFDPGSFGGAGGIAAPSNSAVNIVKRSALHGYSYRGENRFGPFAGSYVDSDNMQTALINAILNVIVSLLVARVGGRFTPAVASTKLGTSKALTEAVLTNTLLDSQKTRLAGHGS